MDRNELITFTDNEMMTALLSGKNMKIFWKDTERRFIGVSKSFLDFYGFESEDRIIGKTDEEMGWHVDPVPFQLDETAVLQQGVAQYDRLGTCIIGGKMHFLRATKLPVRSEKTGEIIGLVGYFEDCTKFVEEKQRYQTLSKVDKLTGLTNRNGFSDIAGAYIVSYEQNGIDFVLYYMNINDFKTANMEHGHKFGDKLLKAVAEDLQRVVGNSSVIVSFGGDEFVIMHQLSVNDRMGSVSRTALTMSENIRSNVSHIYNIDSHSFRVNASVGVAAYSETGDLDKLIEKAHKDMMEEKKMHS